jgi:protein-glutamine gamma-glutamyltransferase
MRFSSAHDVVTYLFAGLGLLSLHLGGTLSPTFGALLAVGFVSSAFLRSALVVSKGYAALVTTAVAVVLLVQVLRAVFSEPFFAMAIEFAALLQISRLAHRRTAADYKQIAGLSVLHLIATTVVTRELSYAALFAGYVIVTPWMLGLTQVREALERQYRDPDRAEHELDPKLVDVLSRRDWVGPGFFVGTAALSLSLVAVTVTLFLAFPRVGGDFIGLRGGAGGAVTGFGGDISLGGFGTIRTDRRVVVRLMREDDDRRPILPLVLRGTSFDRYEDGRWTRTESPAERLSLSRRPLWLTDPRTEREPARFTIHSELVEEPVLLLPEGTIRLERARGASGALVDEIDHRAGVDVRVVDAERGVRRYEVVVERGASPREATDLDRYLALPDGMDRVARLAREVVGRAASPREMAHAIERHFHAGRYEYTLEQVTVEGIDPVEHFLFERRAGHCEYFSTAMVLMLRALGVPARNVTGFVGGRFNEYGGYFAIQQGDAHSWVEALVDGEFVRFDPTPPAREAFGIDDGLVTSLQAFVDSLRMHWYESVVGYGWEDQRRLFSSLRAWARTSPSSSTGPHPDLRGEVDLGALRSIWLPAVLLFVAGFVVSTWRSSRRRIAERPEEVRLLLTLEAQASRLGGARPESETPVEWAERLVASRAPCAEAVAEGVRAYVSLRYEGTPEREADLDSLRRAVDALTRMRGQNWSWKRLKK